MSMPPDPLGNLDQMTTAVHEWFASYRRCGFRRTEALALTIIHLKWILEQASQAGD